MSTKRMGKYELGRVLGHGSFSKVRLGTDTTNGEVFAVKIIDKAQLAKQRLEEQLKREIAVLKTLRHKHIVAMREVLQTSRHIYIVLELVEGGELFEQIVQERRFPEEKARRYFQQLILAVKYCHKQGIAHRDLKPENLLLDKAGHIKISDFGLANLTNDSGDLMSTVCGTPNYVAPEVIRDQGYSGFSADVWSCGIILYVMMSGHQAFDDPNVKALFNKIERGEYQMSRYFTEGAKDLISKILVVDAAKRLTIEEIIQHPWFQVGFDASQLAQTEQIIDVTDDDKKGALQTIPDSDPAASTNPGDGVETQTGDDGFAIAQRMMGATLGSLSKSNPLPSANVASPSGPPPQAPAGAVRGLLYKGKLDAAIKDIHAALKTMAPNVNCMKGEGHTTELKGFVNAKRGLVTFVVEVTPTTVPQMVLVEAKKGRGDVLDFGDMLSQLHTLLAGKVLSQPTM
uniref:non-specific serine/threonine protein kinase n=1 Tax=Neobodo designis TaxID=312471 RepID=A0A7S1W0K7_NEODS|mmetsp:Transcript_48070/g.148342  ORF Transcript_48070/g.148342 Transcript_48070/m.148342 type:complete len:457 (+) Transcript_48070:484-1854(+)